MDPRAVIQLELLVVCSNVVLPFQMSMSTQPEPMQHVSVSLQTSTI